MLATRDFETGEELDFQVCFPLPPIQGNDRVQLAKREIHRLIDQGPTSIELEFDEIRGVSSDLINFLIWCQMECNRNRIQLKVNRVDPEIRKVFRFAGLNQVLDMEAR